VPQYTHACTCIHARAPPPPSCVLPLRYTLSVRPSLVHQHTHTHTCTSTRMHARAPTHAPHKSAQGGAWLPPPVNARVCRSMHVRVVRPLPIQRGARYRPPPLNVRTSRPPSAAAAAAADPVCSISVWATVIHKIRLPESCRNACSFVVFQQTILES
jgi:hypothetical protein